MCRGLTTSVVSHVAISAAKEMEIYCLLLSPQIVIMAVQCESGTVGQVGGVTTKLLQWKDCDGW